ncbi:MAG: hypothetical protein ACQR30_06060, partial [Arachidicoccus sp.]
MKFFNLQNLTIAFLVCMGSPFSNSANAQAFKLQTQYAGIHVNENGFIVSMKDKKTGKEYCPGGMSSALMSLCDNKNQYILPSKANYNVAKKEIDITYPNGSVAIIKVEQKKSYLRFQLLSLTKAENIDNIVWGPYKTTISKKIGDIIGVVRSDDFAIGM